MGDLFRAYGPALLAWLLLLWRLLLSPWRSRNAEQGAVWMVLIGLTASQTLNTPVVYAAVGSLTEVPNLARLLVHITMLLAACGAQVFLLHMNHPKAIARPRSLRRIWWLAVVLVIMVVLFTLAATPIDDVRFAQRYAETPWVLEYWLAYVSYLGPTLVSVTRLCWRYSGQSPDLALRIGLRLVVVGAISGLAYHIHRAIFFAAPRFEFGYLTPGLSDTLDIALPTVSHVMILIGATMPGWGPRVGLPEAAVRLRRYRAYRTLRPLWLALYRADPRIALVPPRHWLADLSPRDLDLLLYRRIIEIRDGRLMLLPYLDPNAATEAQERAAAAGLTGQQLDAEVEAAIFAAALQAKALGSVPPVPAPPPASTPGGTDIDSDVSFLCAVASAFRRHHRTVPRTSEGATDRETVIG